MSTVSRSLVKWRFTANVAFNMLTKFLTRIVPRKKMTVVIEQGTLEGQYYKTKISNKPYVSFLGVPYAKPPINDLRFKPPEKHPGWSGVLNAYSEGNVGLQYDLLITKKIIGSEDCLYLNVFVPLQEELNEKMAVMVFIHGGAFNIGSASPDLYSPDYLIDENVIVVTINYRLNVLGFLNLGIDECPGNMGLKDQLFALKWVKANISAFGGDANNITIFGESAGSASVHCHTLSPESTGLFDKAIMQSGCMFNSWAMHNKHKEVAIKFAKKLGCQQDSPKEIAQYLRNVPAIDLVKCTKVDDKVQGDENEFMYFEFVPSIESNTVTDPFLPDHPDVLVKTASPVPVIIGINNMEGMVTFGELRLGKVTDLHKPEGIRKILEGNNYSEEFINKVKTLYFNENDPEYENNRLDNVCNLISDVLFIKDIMNRGLNQLLKYSGDMPVYNYEFKFDGEINVFKKLLFATRPTFLSLKGACHGDELCYLFYSHLLGSAPKDNSPESRMCKTISKLWSNFAKTGNPNSQDLNFEWNNTSVDNPKYLSFDGDNTKMVDGLLYNTRLNFWKNMP